MEAGLLVKNKDVWFIELEAGRSSEVVAAKIES
jgi:hypothetical protein